MHGAAVVTKGGFCSSETLKHWRGLKRWWEFPLLSSVSFSESLSVPVTYTPGMYWGLEQRSDPGVLCLEGRWQQLLGSGSLRHPQLGLAPVVMDSLFQSQCCEVNQGSGICWSQHSIHPQLYLQCCWYSGVYLFLACRCLHGEEPGISCVWAWLPVVFRGSNPVCSFCPLSAFGSQEAAGPDAWESSPAYLSLYFCPRVELALKHWDLERWFPVYTHPWLWFLDGKDLWLCLFSLASLQYITEPSFVSNKNYSTRLLFGEFCA